MVQKAEARVKCSVINNSIVKTSNHPDWLFVPPRIINNNNIGGLYGISLLLLTILPDSMCLHGKKIKRRQFVSLAF